MARFHLPLGLCVGKTKRGKGSKIMRVTEAGGVVLSIAIVSASPHEVTLVGKALEERFVDELPEKLIGDKAYDSDVLDECLKQEGIELIAPHRSGRKKKATQDGRKLRRYKRRWKAERFLLGCSTTDAVSSAMNTRPKTSKPSCCLPASWSI